jgi:hypothetical protein
MVFLPLNLRLALDSVFSVCSCDSVWQHVFARLKLHDDFDVREGQRQDRPAHWKQRVHRALQLSDDVVLL